MLYQGALTAAVRIQAGRQQVGSATAFRQRMKDVLSEIDREAAKRGYSVAHTTESTFAFVSFLDEVILNSHDPCRDDWAKRPLQEDFYGSATAGEQFFVRLEALLARPDTPELIDVLEVYLLCLRLGYQGRYIIGGRAELSLYSDRTQQKIERSRGTAAAFSPEGTLPSETLQLPALPTEGLQLGRTAAWAAGVAALSFVLFATHLLLKASTIDHMLVRSVVP